MRPFRIGTRGSRLALWQANHIAAKLRPFLAPRGVELVEIKTSGDERPDVSLPRIGGDGLFTKEIQRALLDGMVDVAVHSLKDLPTAPVAGLILAAVPPRGPISDTLVSREQKRFDELPPGALLATGSLRRQAQVLHCRPDIRIAEIRGNVETRLRKLHEQALGGLILAQAGLERLGLHEHISEVLSTDWMLPAVGQGALGLECRAEDAATHEILSQLDHPATRQAVRGERALLAHLGGGCLLPVGVVADVAGETLAIRSAVLDPWGKQRLEASVAGPLADAESLGIRLADALLAQGAGGLLRLAEIRNPKSNSR